MRILTNRFIVCLSKFTLASSINEKARVRVVNYSRDFFRSTFIKCVFVDIYCYQISNHWFWSWVCSVAFEENVGRLVLIRASKGKREREQQKCRIYSLYDECASALHHPHAHPWHRRRREESITDTQWIQIGCRIDCFTGIELQQSLSKQYLYHTKECRRSMNLRNTNRKKRQRNARNMTKGISENEQSSFTAQNHVRVHHDQ